MAKNKHHLTEKKQLPSRVVPAATELWSDSSKQSYAYQSPHHREYSDRQYTCRRCGQPAVFTAEEQREAYEVRKAYIWQTRVLCAACFATRMQIEAELHGCAQRWQTARAEFQADTPFLLCWLGLLQQHVEYGGSQDVGNTHMLQALLRGREG